jgi:hypothetical protein
LAVEGAGSALEIPGTRIPAAIRHEAGGPREVLRGRAVVQADERQLAALCPGRRGAETALVGRFLRLTGKLVGHPHGRQVGPLGLLEQPLGPVVLAALDRRPGVLEQSPDDRVLGLEGGQPPLQLAVPLGDLGELPHQPLRRDLPLAEDAQHVAHGGLGDVEPGREPAHLGPKFGVEPLEGLGRGPDQDLDLLRRGADVDVPADGAAVDDPGAADLVGRRAPWAEDDGGAERESQREARAAGRVHPRLSCRRVPREHCHTGRSRPRPRHPD